MNKKSLIQIVVLVILVAGAAGAYLMQQDGGLDLSFITDFLDKKSPTTPTPDSPKKTTTVRAPSAATATDKIVKPDAPVIPPTPAKGQVHGKPFLVESSTIENGVLTLRLGKDVNADLEIQIVLFTPPWEVPTGKTFKMPGASSNAPQILLVRKETESTEQKFKDKYVLTLEFGQEKDKKLPGKIYLSLPDETKSSVAGTFEADIKGFRMIDGKPDLSADSIDTFQYLVLTDLLKSDSNKNLDALSFRDGRFAPAESAGKNMTGYIEVQYQTAPTSLVVQRFQFEKQAGEWKIAHILNANQLDEAHPLQAPTAKDSPSKVMIYLAAKKLETDIQKKSSKKEIYAPEFTTRHSDKYKIGVCEVGYKLDPNGETLKTSYLFRKQAKGWTLDRALTKNEKVNFDTGRLEKR
ncbi:MAG: hypothetical protein HY081_12175 [Gammaproteobacteria bacterium]|nr:hypothetical protein [Gammaproteobacteria bacterium]